MTNEIYIRGKRILEFTTIKIGRIYNRQFTLDGGVLILNKDIKKSDIQYKCSDCGCFVNRTLSTYHLFDKIYYCKSCSCRGERSGFYGKNHSDEFKHRLSAERKGVWNVGDKNPMRNPEVRKKHLESMQSDAHRKTMSNMFLGDKNPFYGKKHSETSRKQMSESQIKYVESIPEEERKEKSLRASNAQSKLLEDDPVTYKRNRAKAARKSHKSQFGNYKMNGIETTVYEYVKSIKPNARYSVMLASYQFDIGIKENRILIEVAGDYWHGNPKYFNEDGTDGKRRLNEIQKTKQHRDMEKTEWAISRGFTLIRIWECEVRDGTFKDKLKILL
jgi:G:T-mismatch repair DNA endonuclease (very short patch repair protein)